MSEFATRIPSHYERHASAWDCDRRTASYNDRPCHSLFIQAVSPAASVLDLGCGSGLPAEYMAASGLRITGVDTSPTLISLCLARLPNHQWLVADMRTLSLGRKFGGILAWDSFFHLTPHDQRRMFPIFAAHAGPSAALLFNGGPAYGEAIGQYRGDPLYHASLDPSEYESLLDEWGFELIAHKAEDPNAGGRIYWLARLR
jgi:SAM-dependent methyltransferase